MKRASWLAGALALAALGCPSPGSGGSSGGETTCASCRHSTSAKANRTSSSAAAASSSGGSSADAGSSAPAGTSSSGESTAPTTSGSSTGGGGSSSGSSGGLVDGGFYPCPAVAVPPVPVSCPSGDLGLSSQLVDALDCTTIDGASVQALDPTGIPYPQASATSDPSDGTFTVCVPQESPFTLQVTAASYPNTYLAELQGVQPTSIPQMTIASNAAIAALSAFFPGGVDHSDGVILLKVSATRSCDPALPGWTFGLSIPDGGPVADGGALLTYLAPGGLPGAGLTDTTTAGGGAFYNINPTLGNFFDISYQNPDAGICEPTNAALGFTSRIYTAGSAFSIYPIILP